ncbi:MAG TPA: hypothetical protein VGR62_20555 [Candidatus Binatia bacterium]|jgi:hypothetical protein|nr:hypothetical protein [Candidatus Binatia bacterium]
MMSRFFAVPLALALSTCLVVPASAATVVDLGSFLPIGINRHGVVVGDILDFNADDAVGHAGMWANGVLTPLPERPGVVLTDALAISDTGRIVGLEYVDGNNVHAIFWDGAVLPTQIGPLSNGYDFSQAVDVDALGNVVGSTTVDGPPHYLFGFYAPAGGGPIPVGVGDLDADQGNSRVGAISGDGATLLGEVTGTDSADGYYLWSTATPAAPGIKLDITPDRNAFSLFGGSIYSPLLIQNTLANDGAVFGFKEAGEVRTWFLRTPDGTETPIVGLAAHNGINARHLVVGTLFTGNMMDPVRAAKWDPTTKTVTDLNTLLPPSSGFVLYDALAISDTGDIVGLGVHDGVEVGFLLRSPALTAQAVASPAQVKIDPNINDAIQVVVTLLNSTEQTLAGVAATGAPTVAGTGAVEAVGAPVPPSVDLAPGQSGTITYTFKPTKAGKVTLTFPGFADASGTVQNDEGSVSTGEVKIVDVTVEVTVTPSSLASDSSRNSFGVVRIKVIDSKGQPIVGQRVRLKVPRWFGALRDRTPSLLVCDDAGARIYPPGENPILDNVRIATTGSSGELVYGLWLGTDRTAPPSTQLFVPAEAIDDAGALISEGGKLVDIATPTQGPAPGVDLAKRQLDERQTSELPPGQRQDPAGVTGRGAPTAVLQSLIRWLESERERGFPALQNVDFGPITTIDGTQAGVVFFPRGQGALVLEHLRSEAGANPPGGAFVLQMEVSQLDPRGRHEVQWTRDLMSLATWETTRPLNALGIENAAKPIRGRAVAATGVVTSDPNAFFGFPYATASPTGGYAGSCLPVMNGVGVDVHSPVTLLVKDAAGGGVGFDAAGAYTNELEGGTYAGGEPSQYLLPPGTFTADINGTDSGKATIVLTASGASGVTAKTVALKAKAGKTGTLEFDDSLAAPRGTFNKRRLKVKGGVPLAISGLKRRVKVQRGDELTLSVRDAFGSPVQGARVHATGKGFDASTVTATDGSAAMPLLLTKSVRMTVEVSGAGLETKKVKVAVKVRK